MCIIVLEWFFHLLHVVMYVYTKIETDIIERQLKISYLS